MKSEEEHVEIIRAAFLELSEHFLIRGNTLESLESVVNTRKTSEKERRIFSRFHSRKILIAIALPIFLAIIVKSALFDTITKYALETKCVVPNNYLIWEFTRPLSNCDYCENVSKALVLPNLTRQDFEPYAYSPRPMIVKGAAGHWEARRIFNISFFRNLYENIEDAYTSIDDDCQFLQFKSDFVNLRQVFEMSEKRASNNIDEDSWYVGWKNCHPDVLKVINEFYDTPHFLPHDAEVPATNYIFLGYEQGAVMHLDYIPRLMWQGQIVGSKTWTVAPTPECENVCKTFNFSVDTGDIVLLDTRIWYHGTYVKNGELSLTITSEYG